MTERRGTPADLLVMGLGNPGQEYSRSRHNVGAEVVEELARRHGGRLKKARQQRALTAEVSCGQARLALAVPTTYVNLSGDAAASLIRRYGIDDLEHLVVVHDELDLEPGVVRIKQGGGLAGHNGLRSITQHLKTQDYLRVRIGWQTAEQGAGSGPRPAADPPTAVRSTSRSGRDRRSRPSPPTVSPPR